MIMRKIIPLMAGALLLGAATAQAERPDREAELARALEGLEAGEPVDCIDTYRIQSSRIIQDTAIIYDLGPVTYVNRPRAGAESLNRWDAMLTRLPFARLCSIDTVQMIDTSTQMQTGVVFLGEFVPYRRVQAASAD
jgi:hypothetical protein